MPDLVHIAISDMTEDDVLLVPAVEVWKLVTNCQKRYAKKYAR